jgi:hypothetical protein
MVGVVRGYYSNKKFLTTMIYFTKYADQKFDILNKHKVYFTREQIEDVVVLPDKTGRKKGGYLVAAKDGVKVIYKKEGAVLKIITFYPIKNF